MVLVAIFPGFRRKRNHSGQKHSLVFRRPAREESPAPLQRTLRSQQPGLMIGNQGINHLIQIPI